MKCQRCNSERIADVFSKCRDIFIWKSDKIEFEGYAIPPGGEFGKGTPLEFKYCLECGQIQYSFPVPSEWDKDDMED